MSKKEKSDYRGQLTIDDAVNRILKTHGQGSIITGQGEKVKWSVISSGSIAIDHALGIGGYPRGRITEIFGAEGAGKTTLTLETIANAQKNGTAAFIDAEHALDPEYAKSIGVDMDKLLVSQPDSGEQVMDIVQTLLRTPIDMIVVDSVAALATQEELQKGPSEHTMGGQARLMSEGLRKIVSLGNKKAALIFVNQLREKIGLFFGSPETTPGGRALKFYATVRIDIRRSTAVKDSAENTVGHLATVKVIKNKLAAPFKVADVMITYGYGINLIHEILEYATKHEIIEISGSWYNYNKVRLGLGEANAIKFLEENPDTLTEIEHKVRMALGLFEGDKNDAAST